jgi:hypothetical protein
MSERAAIALGRSAPWLLPLTQRTHARFSNAPTDRPGELASSLARDRGLVEALWNRREIVRVRRYFLPAPTMGVPRPDWDVAALATTSDVAAWLSEDVESLAWLADWRGLSRHERDPRLRHYVYRSMPKRGGGVRLLEAPKSRLKAIQHRILREILDRVPCHEAAHGFRSGRSVLSHARSHAGCEAVLRMDLEDFFASVAAARVRLAAAARSAGATYTRYADDLVFSGDASFARSASRFSTLVAAVVLDEGFHVQHRKTRLMRRTQRQEVTGLVVNERPAIRRDDYDRLRAILHNCVRLGPEHQNRDGLPDLRSYLEGAVAWVGHVQPARGAKLAALLRAIAWAQPSSAP